MKAPWTLAGKIRGFMEEGAFEMSLEVRIRFQSGQKLGMGWGGKHCRKKELCDKDVEARMLQCLETLDLGMEVVVGDKAEKWVEMSWNTMWRDLGVKDEKIDGIGTGYWTSFNKVLCPFFQILHFGAWSWDFWACGGESWPGFCSNRPMPMEHWAVRPWSPETPLSCLRLSCLTFWILLSQTSFVPSHL